jgi:hypothetical protein
MKRRQMRGASRDREKSLSARKEQAGAYMMVQRSEVK